MDTATDPVCPTCRAAWSYEFLTEILTKSFRTGVYKIHRERILLDRERARLPETQEHAMAYKSAIDLIKPLDEEIERLRDHIHELPITIEYKKARDAYSKHLSGLPWKEHFEYIKTEECKLKIHNLNLLQLAYHAETKSDCHSIREIYANTRIHRQIRNHYGLLPGKQESVRESRFIRKCPANSCEGFLSKNLTCGLCGIHACKDCHEIKQEDHVCDPAIVETVKALAKEAKPCPTCSALISKIDGCDQMWCTQCKTAFSWRTGAIETSIVHNPHYFQWMRETGRTLARQPGDVECNIHHRIENYVTRVTPTIQDDEKKYYGWCLNYLNNLNHLRAVDLENHRRSLQALESDEWRRILRVKRMVNEIDDDAWKKTLQKKEKSYHKERVICQLLDMYTNAGYDILAQIIDNPDIKSVLREMKKLYLFADEQAIRITNTYGCVEIDLNPIE